MCYKSKIAWSKFNHLLEIDTDIDKALDQICEVVTSGLNITFFFVPQTFSVNFLSQQFHMYRSRHNPLLKE